MKYVKYDKDEITRFISMDSEEDAVKVCDVANSVLGRSPYSVEQFHARYEIVARGVYPQYYEHRHGFLKGICVTLGIKSL